MRHSLRLLGLRLAIIIGLCMVTPLSAVQAAPRADTVLPPIPVGTQPYAVAVNPVTNKIYVANNCSDGGTVIDGANNATDTVSSSSTPTSCR